ncbi:MAG: undecaprenyl-diphosphate phosphatase, partial [Firmicutes bacterium]|nr:undecaprenyl-diphosphate phosphatase [Bacillota bacterium]
MNVLEAAFLGLVQGLTEFLPVSSSGHLVFFQNLLGVESAGLLLSITLHLGTLVAVCIVYKNELLALLRKPLQRTTYLLIAGTVPAIIVTLLLGDAIDSAFAGGSIFGFEFIITGFVLLWADRLPGGNKKVKNMSYLDAIIVGGMQAAAITPGISRSGMTVAGSLYRRLDRESAASYSFLLSVIAILGGLVITLKDIADGGASAANAANIGALPLIVGFVVAAVSGYFAIRFMLNL